MEHPAQETKETMPLGPTGHPLHKVALPRLGDTAEHPKT